MPNWYDDELYDNMPDEFPEEKTPLEEAKEAERIALKAGVKGFKFGWYSPSVAESKYDNCLWETIAGTEVEVTSVTEKCEPPPFDDIMFSGLVIVCTKPANSY